MRFEVNKWDLLKTLKTVQGVVGKKNTMPILSSVLIEAVTDRVNVLATDLEVFIKDSTAATVEEKGAVTVNARKLFDIVKEFPEGTVDVSLNGGDKVTLKGGKARFNVVKLPAKEFPTFPAVDEAELEEIGEGTLEDMVDKTAFAVSMDETRYNINGFLVEKDGSKVRLVTTDGHRLAIAENEANGIPVPEKGVILPFKGVTELRKLLRGDGECSLYITEKSAVAKKGDTLLTMRLFEGEFPDYKQVIPKDNDQVLMVERSDLLEALKRVSILLNDRVKAVKFQLSKDRLVLSTLSPDIGDATEEIDVEYSSDDMEIAFNAGYLIDVLDVMDGGKVRMELKDPSSPAVLRPQDSNGHQCIVMPMRL